ncbi:MAG TPA: HAD family hydrolase [Candidatus Thermoplasmatota archaeon]|nr:HAD family hydrolase [Candidatus Thermoplasmatota archaeon]
MDRTFTRQDSTLSSDAIQRAKQLRRNGVRVILVTGRPERELALHALQGCFDRIVLEGGALWGKPGRWVIPVPPVALSQAAAVLESRGHEVRSASASFSVTSNAETDLSAFSAALAWRRNRERIDVTPPGVGKATGLQMALKDLGVADAWVLAIGDGLNDVPLLQSASVGVAVANAEPELLAVAHIRAPHPAHRGFLWAVSRLGHGTRPEEARK